jgi:L-asparaginase II/GNAT superfamily N-acetyltransferase
VLGGPPLRREPSSGPALSASALDPCYEPLLAVMRGTAVESIHRGAVVVVDAEGALVGGVGDPLAEVLLRSSAKPFQAAAIVASGAAEAFSLGDEEIAVIAASHAGAGEHVQVVFGLLARAGLSSAALVCGSAEHMCSGKHAGMLLLARHLGVAVEGYEREDHPVQQEVARYVTSLLDACLRRSRRRADPSAVAASDGGGDVSRSLFAGRDGCGVPVIRTTLYEAAWLYAALAAGVTPALARVRDAMLAHPALVAGETRFDTRLMRAAPGRVAAKGGAEGVQGIGLLSPAAVPPRGVGCIIKVEDGSARPIPAVMAVLLRAWGATEAAVTIEGDYSPSLVDGAGVEVGRLEVLAERASLRWRGVSEPVGELTADAGIEAGTHHGGLSPGTLQVGRRLFAGKNDRVTVCQGDEKDVLRFLRDQWPSVDEENFGRAVEWSAEPYALVFRREKKIVAVLRGHFIGGIASVDELMVGEGSRASGLGSLLLGRFEDEARRRACSRIILRAVKGSPAEDFYRGRGYHRECVQYGYEFGFDYVRLICDVESALGEAGGPAGEGKGAR